MLTEWRVSTLDPQATFGSLSGGNMQRVLVGRELMKAPRLLVALNPTHGLDVNSALAVSAAIRRLCDGGAAALIFTTDLDEAVALGDRVAVMREGRISEPTGQEAISRSELGRMMVLGW